MNSNKNLSKCLRKSYEKSHKLKRRSRALALGLAAVCVFVLLSGCGMLGKTESSVYTWPVCRNTEGIPKPDYAIDYAFDEDGETGIVFVDVSEDEARQYLRQIKNAGYTNVESSSEVEGAISYVAKREDGERHLCYTYEPDEKRLSIFIDTFNI